MIRARAPPRHALRGAAIRRQKEVNGVMRCVMPYGYARVVLSPSRYAAAIAAPRYARAMMPPCSLPPPRAIIRRRRAVVVAFDPSKIWRTSIRHERHRKRAASPYARQRRLPYAMRRHAVAVAALRDDVTPPRRGTYAKVEARCAARSAARALKRALARATREAMRANDAL